jgi:hypothetical protein
MAAMRAHLLQMGSSREHANYTGAGDHNQPGVTQRQHPSEVQGLDNNHGTGTCNRTYLFLAAPSTSLR